MVLAAVRQCGSVLEAASEEMKGDHELCMVAVTQDGQALQWASEEMKGDRELCMAAVAQDWCAHLYASKEAQKDNDIRAAVMGVVQKDCYKLGQASEEMKGDRELCMAAVAQTSRALQESPWMACMA